MKRHSTIRTGILTALALLATVSSTFAGVRIKDITDLEGARSNQLVGFGLVVGLKGTGSKGLFTQKVAVDMLQRFDVSNNPLGQAAFKSSNISAVMVTADLGPFARRGSRIDVIVSAFDDATSLAGGVLIETPLRGADKVDYAVAQGPVIVNGFSFTASGGTGDGTVASADKNHPTVGRMTSGATVEREARGKIVCNGQLRLLLREADYATSKLIATAINSRFPAAAFAIDAGTVQIYVPADQLTDAVNFISEIGHIEVTPDVAAKVVINERLGTLVAGQMVKISTVAITHGNLSIITYNEPIASQPLPYSRGKTVVLPRGQVNVTEQNNVVRVLPETMTVGELAHALNSLGATPRDLISILTTLKQAGALHAEVIVN
jgi:flagellar P-ring protein precursor FlgI